MLLFIICSRRSWILDSKRLYSVGTGLVSAATAAPRDGPHTQTGLDHEASCPRGSLSPHTKLKRLQNSAGVQAGHLEQAGFQLLPTPPQLPTQQLRQGLLCHALLLSCSSMRSWAGLGKLLTYRAVQNTQRETEPLQETTAHQLEQ